MRIFMKKLTEILLPIAVAVVLAGAGIKYVQLNSFEDKARREQEARFQTIEKGQNKAEAELEINYQGWRDLNLATQNLINKEPKKAAEELELYTQGLLSRINKKNQEEQPKIHLDSKSFDLSALDDYVTVNIALVDGIPRAFPLVEEKYAMIDPSGIADLGTKALERTRLLLRDYDFRREITESYKLESIDCKAFAATFASSFIAEANNIPQTKKGTNTVRVTTGLHFNEKRIPVGHAWTTVEGKIYDNLMDTNQLNYLPISTINIIHTPTKISPSLPKVETYPQELLNKR